ncbi:MAG: S24 family peptidase [Flavobacterium lindanitolerans]|nr:S24 family peptidase [Flavobacterium lindanitolerans]
MFVNINPDWLLNGKGEMYRNQNTKYAENVTIENGNGNGNENGTKPNMQKKLPYQVNPYILRTDSKKENQIIPLYNMEASAGLVQLLDNHSDQKPIDFISIPNLPNCDGALFVTGDSMYPLLKSGDIIAYKQVKDIENDIFWGEMYLISIDVGDEELVTVKYVQKSEKDGHIKLVSQNKNHQDKDVKISKIRALALVKASIRYNMMT